MPETTSARYESNKSPPKGPQLTNVQTKFKPQLIELNNGANLSFAVADFSQALATLHDRFGHELQMLVETFRKRNGELRKER